MKKLRNSIAFKSIAGIVASLIVFSVIVSIIGYMEFKDAMMQQYARGAFYTARAAALTVNADHLQMYLASGGTEEEYIDTQQELSKLCNSQGAAFVYVIQPVQPDYGKIVFVMVAASERTNYPVYSCGYVRDTTNDEYRQKYRALYEQASEYELVIRDKGYIETDPHITAMVPLVGLDGRTKAILCVQRQMRTLVKVRQDYVTKIFQAMLVMVLLVILGEGIYFHKLLLEPLQKVIKEATRFSTENIQIQEKLTDTIRSRDEMGELAKAIDDMEDQIAGYVSHLTRVTAEEERIQTELSLASRIQAAMLPNVFPPFPERREFELFASMDPAREVGGDFYDFLLVDDDHLYMVIADVSGKGIPAALFMTTAKVILAQYIIDGKPPEEVLETANDAICATNREEMFISVWIGILEISTGKLTAANAGHEYPVIKKPDGRFELIRDKHGFVLGGMEGMQYTEYEIRMEPGSSLFVYTDGVPEAADSSVEQFGLERMLTALNEDPGAHPEEIVHCVRRAVDSFTGEAEQFDDMTMLCLRYNGNETYLQNQVNDTENSAGSQCSEKPTGSSTMTGNSGAEEESVKELTLEATLDNIPEVTAFVDNLLEKAECPMKAQMQIDVAIDELFSNIARYAYKGRTGKATVRLEIEKQPRAVAITFIDHGVPYNPLKQKDPDITLDADERPIGGLGIFVVKKTMDDVQYEHKDGTNILRIKKRI